VRDFLNSSGVGRFSPGRLQLTDGTMVLGRHPQLVCLIDPLPQGRDGIWPPDNDALGVDLPSGDIGLVRLEHVWALELPATG
jgi:hypothetical protein